jgi:hypothetical protein
MMVGGTGERNAEGFAPPKDWHEHPSRGPDRPLTDANVHEQVHGQFINQFYVERDAEVLQIPPEGLAVKNGDVLVNVEHPHVVISSE